MRGRSPSIVLAIIVAGALTGVADTLLTLAASPDPGLLTYKLSYVFGPILFALVWAGPTGAVAAVIEPRGSRRRRIARAPVAEDGVTPDV